MHPQEADGEPRKAKTLKAVEPSESRKMGILKAGQLGEIPYKKQLDFQMPLPRPCRQVAAPAHPLPQGMRGLLPGEAESKRPGIRCLNPGRHGLPGRVVLSERPQTKW